MKLNENFRYIGLDFETTGLDIQKDEPIQIGIVEMDHHGTIINEFVSLLKPTKDINELKTIVGFITGIAVEDIANAPTPEAILTNISPFFGENTVLIGHNIAFDLQFLNKFFPNLHYKDSLDTFPLAQTMIHYKPSYALEVLVPGENAHNALQDTKNALILFQQIIERIEHLGGKFPILNTFFKQKAFCLSEYLTGEESIHFGPIQNIPKLTKIMGANTQVQKNEKSINTEQLENQKRYFVGNSCLKTFLERIVSNKNIILAFSNLQKLNIAKSILTTMGLKNLGFLKEEQTIDYQKFEDFLNKKEFTNAEVGFILKYYSHVDQGLGILDLNYKNDYQIYHVIKSKKEKTRYPIILATHQGLFSYLQEQENQYEDYETFFFDAEWRYKSYNLFLSRPIDMYYTLNFIETLIYKRDIENQLGQAKTDGNQLSEFYTCFQIFIGQLSIESKQLFTGNSLERIQSNPITTEPNFYKTNLLRKQLKENSEKLISEVEEADYSTLNKQIDHIDRLFNTVITIEKKMANDDMYFVYSEHTQYTSRPEFIDIFPSPIYFISNSDKSAIHLFPNEIYTPSIKTTKIGLYERIVSYLSTKIAETNNKTDTNGPSFFIASTRKEESKQLFEMIYKSNLHNQYTIVAENITGGAGKNLFKVKNNLPKVIIGGYAFLLALYADNIALDEIIIFNIRGNNEQSILDDMQWYANK